MNRAWTTPERDIIREHYPSRGAAATAEVLAHMGYVRAPASVRQEACKLGIENTNCETHCMYCDAPIKAHKFARRQSCDACRQKMNEARDRKRKRKCVVCGELYAPTSSSAVTCGTVCRQKRRRQIDTESAERRKAMDKHERTASRREYVPDVTITVLSSENKRDAIKAILASCIVLSVTCITRAATTTDILDAIQRVETGGHKNPSQAVGDGGRSIGPYQISRAYWQDSGVAGRYEMVRDEAYARRVVIAYARRYEPAALRRGDAEVLARLHNSGVGWRKKMRATDGYWHKVRRAMP